MLSPIVCSGTKKPTEHEGCSSYSRRSPRVAKKVSALATVTFFLSVSDHSIGVTPVTQAPEPRNIPERFLNPAELEMHCSQGKQEPQRRPVSQVFITFQRRPDSAWHVKKSAQAGTGALILLASRGPSRWQHAILEQAEDPNERRVRSPESGLTPRPEMQSKKVQKCPVRLLRGPNP